MSHLIRSACLTDYVEVARSVGLEPHRMVDAFRLPRACLRNPDMKIPVESVIRLLEASAKAAEVDTFGLRLSERRLLSNLGPVGLIAREQPTARMAIEALARYIWLHSDALSARIEEQDDLVIISPVLSVRRSLPTRQVTELQVGVLCRILRTFLGGAWKPQAICFTHGPPRTREIHRRQLGSRVEFGQDSNAVLCRARDLETPLPASDPVMARYIQRYLESIATQPNVTASDKVREFIWMLLPSGRCSVELIAEHMGVDRRTIHRRLGHEGNTFTSIVEGVRTENAIRYLEDPNRPLHLIAEALGFSALSAFSRWFRARYGCSASEWRAGAFNT